MRKMKYLLTLTFLLASLTGCSEHSHDDGSHSHHEEPTEHDTID